MYNIIRIHKPSTLVRENAVEISTLSTIPEFLREAVQIVNHEIWMDSEAGTQTAPLGSVIGYEKSGKTTSGYSCWFIARAINLKKVSGSFYTKPSVLQAMFIPAEDEAKPVWVNSCKLKYNGDGTATLHTARGSSTGRIGIDLVATRGMKKDGKPDASIITRDDESYNDYIISDEKGQDIGKLCELYPA